MTGRGRKAKFGGMFVYNRSMNTIYSSITLVVILFLSACAPKNEWTSHSVDNDAGILPYTFEYPSSWTIDPGNNYIGFVSDADLLKDVPRKLKPGQIIVGLTMNITMEPEQMVLIRSEGLDDIIRFSDPVSFSLNGRPAVYQEGVNMESKDETLFIAADAGRNMRVLLTSRMAEGERTVWRETLMSMVQSLQIKP